MNAKTFKSAWSAARLPLLLTVFLHFLMISYAWAGELLIEGVYQGTNLYIENPHDASKQAFCISEVLINGKKMSPLPQASAFEIILSHLKKDEAVSIRILHRDDCKPKIINPNSIRVRNEFQFTSLDINNDFINWVSKGEKKHSKYFIEKFEHNSWITEEVVECQGNAGNNVYKIDAPHHSGLNKYRVKYLDITGKSYYSQVVEFTAAKAKVEFYPQRVSTTLNFSHPVKFEILDAYGNVVIKGSDKVVDCTKLKMGTYYVSFDNRTEKFFKK